MRAQEDGSAGKSMKQNTSGYLLALLAVVIWSGNFVVARAVADMIPPWQCNFWRWFTAFVTICPLPGVICARTGPLCAVTGVLWWSCPCWA